MKKTPPSAAWLAEQVLFRHTLVGYADDAWIYSSVSGLHRRLPPSEFRSLVEHQLIDLLGSSQVGSRLTADVCESVKNRAYLDSGKLSPPFWKSSRTRADVLPVANGLLDLGSATTVAVPTLKPFTDDLFAVAGSPCSFNPTARCPKWRAFIRWMVRNDPAEIKLLAEYAAWALIAHLPGMRFERLLWLTGPGRNGKSLFLRVIREVYGADNCSAVGLEAFGGGEAFRLQPALFKIANFIADAGVRRKSSVAMLNAFISGDPIVVNRKYREQLIVEPPTTIFVASNDPPAFHDASDAIWRRLLVVRCDRQLTAQQAKPSLFHVLIKERDGILGWMLDALPHLVARQRFDVPVSVQRNVEALKGEANAARMFLMERVERGGADDYLPADLVMADFAEWCENNGYRMEPLAIMKTEMLRLFGSNYERLRRGNPSRRLLLWAGLRMIDSIAVKEEPPEKEIRELKEQNRELTSEIALDRTRLSKATMVIREKEIEVAQLQDELDEIKVRVGEPACATALEASP
jgi:P4 family phage/plasmid primase-like protien